MMLRKTTTKRLCILLTIVGVALLSASALCAGTQKSKLIIVRAVTTADAENASSKVNVIAADDRFVRVRVSQNTNISRNKSRLSFAEVKKGYKIICKGSWVADDKNEFSAADISVTGVASNSEVMDRIGAACKKLAGNGAPKDTPQLAAPAAPPQLAVIDWTYCQDSNRSSIRGRIKNLTDRPMTQLTATAHYYTKDGKYIVSSMPHIPNDSFSAKRGLSPGEETRFIIHTKWISNEYPELPTNCEVEFECVNQGDLKTEPAVLKIEAR